MKSKSGSTVLKPTREELLLMNQTLEHLITINESGDVVGWALGGQQVVLRGYEVPVSPDSARREIIDGCLTSMYPGFYSGK